MRVIYGLQSSWLTPNFYVERGKAYDPSDVDVAQAHERHPWAFSADFTDRDEPVADDFTDEAVVRRGPGRPRNV